MPKLSALPLKAVPTTADEITITDKADSNATKRITANSLPLSAAAVSALATKAPTASPTFTGNINFPSGKIDSSGNLGVGTSSPRKRGDFGDGDMIIGDTGVASKYWLGRPADGAGSSYIGHESTSDNDLTVSVSSGGASIKFHTALAERMRLDSTGRLGVGTSSPQDFIHVHGGGQSSGVMLTNGTTGSGASDGARLVMDTGGKLQISNRENNAITFRTNDTERMRLGSSGNLLVGKASADDGATAGFEVESSGRIFAAASGTAPMVVNRLNSDGTLMSMKQDGTQEGTISVSGTTVSYNGGHLARWSRMLDGSKPENLLKGTVMTNLDEMIEWAYPETPEVLWAAGDGLPEGVSVGDVKVEGVEATYWEEGDELPEGVQVGDVKTEAVEEVLWSETDGFPEGVSIGDIKVEYKPAGVEDNEQLNHTAISSVEGDKDVAGVFIAWDDDDDYNDYHLAMAGDVIIRIAEGVEVKRGDLLVSAGDGTAKPQDDDIIRSSTVAKVTSTVVSCTYDDGSFCVPCVLK